MKKFIWTFMFFVCVAAPLVHAQQTIALNNFIFVGGAITEGETESEDGLQKLFLDHLNTAYRKGTITSIDVDKLKSKKVWVGLDFFTPPNELLMDKEILAGLGVVLPGMVEVEDGEDVGGWWQANKPLVKAISQLANKWKDDDYAKYGVISVQKSMRQHPSDLYYLAVPPDFVVYGSAKTAIDMLGLGDLLSEALSDDEQEAQQKQGFFNKVKSGGVNALAGLTNGVTKSVYTLKVKPMLTNKILPGIKLAVQQIASSDKQKVKSIDMNVYSQSANSSSEKDFDAFWIADNLFQNSPQYYAFGQLILADETVKQDYGYPVPSMIMEVFVLNLLIDQINQDFQVSIPFKEMN
ncbi:MAG: hypothetical protein KDK51_01425 [Deltaproteobacteria bacterium]|nr:hypothetical protein [Deltaproteobacteria bacterium]